MTSITIVRSEGVSTVQGDRISAYTASFGLSLGLTSLFNALLAIIKETNEPVLAWMNDERRSDESGASLPAPKFATAV